MQNQHLFFHENPLKNEPLRKYNLILQKQKKKESKYYFFNLTFISLSLLHREKCNLNEIFILFCVLSFVLKNHI